MALLWGRIAERSFWDHGTDSLSKKKRRDAKERDQKIAITVEFFMLTMRYYLSPALPLMATHGL